MKQLRKTLENLVILNDTDTLVSFVFSLKIDQVLKANKILEELGYEI